jgi:pimeloyl-ACP methyl ester carboxylesterase
VTETRAFRRGRFEALPAQPRRPHRYFDVPASSVRVESVPFGPMNVHVRALGEGPPLLLVHGLMTTSYSWRYVLHELARDHRVIAPDLPGCGRSDKPAGARYSGAALATFILELQRTMGLRGCPVVGNSMGGYLCMRAALDDPGAFSRMVNLHSPAGPDWRHHALHAVLSVPGVKALLAWWIRRAPRRWAHRNVHYYDETLKSLEEAGEYGDPLATPEGVHAFIRYLWQTFKPADLNAFLADLGSRRFPVPLLLLYSRQDPLVPPAVGEVLHRLVPEAPLVWLDDTSHFAHVDTPEQVLAPVRAFLGST